MDRREVILAGGIALPDLPAHVAHMMKEQLTFRVAPLQPGGVEKILRHYAELDGYLVVPRMYGLRYFERVETEERGWVSHWEGRVNRRRVIDRRTCPEAEFEFLGTPRDYQWPILAQLQDELRLREGTILQASPGVGKTFMSCFMIAALRTCALVLVDSDLLRDQWVRRIHQFLGIPPEEIGLVAGADQRFGKVTVAMVQTLMSRDCTDFLKRFGFLILDEVHVLGPPVFSTALAGQTARFRLGLSATPRRRDGLDKVLFYHIGPVGVVSDVRMMVPRIKIVHIESAATEEECSLKTTRGSSAPSLSKINKVLVNDEHRSSIVMHEICELLREGAQHVLVLAHYKKHLNVLRKVLSEDAPDIRSCLLVGGAPTRDKAREARAAAEGAQVVFATWAYASKGMDIPSLDALVLASPQSEIEQSVGRVCREHPGKRAPIVVDVADSCALKLAYARWTFYYEQGWSVEGAASLDRPVFQVGV